MHRSSPPDSDNRMSPSDSEVKSTRQPADDVLDSNQIFGLRRSVWIRHGEHLYRLQITQQGKLILTK